MGPPGNNQCEVKKSIWSVGFQNRIKRVHFRSNFRKIFKHEDFGFEIFEKGHILRPFSGLALSKLIIFFKINNLTLVLIGC